MYFTGIDFLLPFLQLEQEMSMILEGKDVVKTAGCQWSLKWVPAILGYARSLKTKAAVSTLKEADQLYSCMCYIFKFAAILRI